MSTIPYLLGEALIGWLAADFASGVFHWIQDRLLPEDMPLLGAYLVQPARLHHAQPLAFVEGSFLYRNGATYALAAVVGIAGLLFGASPAFLILFILGIGLTTDVHYWAHCPKDAPAIVRALQETGLIQSAKQHSRHHRPPNTSHYCALTDILNPIAEQVRLWLYPERRTA